MVYSMIEKGWTIPINAIKWRGRRYEEDVDADAVTFGTGKCDSAIIIP